MKKCLSVLFFLFYSFAYSEEFNLGTLEVFTFNSIFKIQNASEILLRYETEDKAIYLFTEDLFGISSVKIEKELRFSFITNLNKFIRWDQKAIQKQVTFEKEISTLEAPLIWKFGNELHSSLDPITISFGFISQGTNHNQLYLSFSEATSKKNEYITKKIDTFYLNQPEVKNFLQFLSADYIKEQYLKQKEEKQTIDSEFN